MNKRAFLTVLCVLLSLICGVPGSFSADSKFPSKNISWIIPSESGGGYDVYARAVGRKMQKFLPKDVEMIYLNLPAGGGVEAMTKLYNAKPDGYTLGIVKVPGSIVSELTLPFAKYESAKLVCVGNITTDPYSVIVKKGSPINSLKDMQQRGTVKFATTGIGATSWVNTVVLAKELGFTAKYVHFTSTADAMLAVIRGDTEALAVPLFSAIQYVQSGDVKILAAFASQRVKQTPDVPTIGELGYPHLASLSLARVIACPPKTPAENVKVIEDAFWKAINDEELVTQLEKSKRPIIDPMKGTEAADLVKSSIEVFTKYKPDLEGSLKQHLSRNRPFSQSLCRTKILLLEIY